MNKRKITVNNSNRMKEFTPVIEDVLPKIRRGISDDILETIFESVDKLEKGQSFFIPKEVISATSLRKELNEYMNEHKSFFKDWELRVVTNNQDKVQGCRVARFN